MASTARRAVVIAMVTAALTALLFSTSARAQSSPYDPGFHAFTPGHWINDPNGPYRDPTNGRIHLYMQYNPYSPLWGNVTWYHITSTDYVKWTRATPNVSMFNNRWYDDWGVYSGSMMDNNYSEPVAVYTCTETENIQRQCIANPIRSDLEGRRLFNTLEKSPLNPVMTEDDVPGLVGLGNFRDPTEWWPDPAHPGRWLIAFVARILDDEGDNAHVVIFSTEDPTFQSGYKFSHSLYVYKYDLDIMFECPDFFTVANSDEHFLKVSTMPSHRDYIVYGSYELDAASGEYVYVEDPERSFTFLDYGPYYAGKTFYDPILKRRFIWGWTNEELSDDQIVAMGYAGVQSIRDMAYDSSEQRLKYPPMAAMKTLRKAKLYSNYNIVLSAANDTLQVLKSSVATTKYQEIVAQFRIPPALFGNGTHYREHAPEFGLRVRMNANASNYTAVSVQMPLTNATATRAYCQVDYPFKIHALPDNGDPILACKTACDRLRLCEAWDIKYQPYADECTLYWKMSQLHDFIGCVSGRPNVPLLHLNRTLSASIGARYPLHGRAPLTSANPDTVVLHVFVDNSVIEVFKDDGLEVLTGRVYIPDQADGDIFSGVSVYMRNMPGVQVEANVTVYAMGTMWAEEPRQNVVRNYTNKLGDLLSFTPGAA